LLPLPIDQLLAELGTTRDGLRDSDVADRCTRFGPNELDAVARRALVWQIARRLVDPLVAILVVAATVSVFAGETHSALLILGIVAASVAIETFQSRRAQRTVDLLRARAAPTATVRRGGATRTIPRRELVPGDVLELDAGDLVPADARLVTSRASAGTTSPAERRMTSPGTRSRRAISDHWASRNTEAVGTMPCRSRSTAALERVV